MRETDTSRIFKLYSMDDLAKLKLWLSALNCAMDMYI